MGLEKSVKQENLVAIVVPGIAASATTERRNSKESKESILDFIKRNRCQIENMDPWIVGVAEGAAAGGAARAAASAAVCIYCVSIEGAKRSHMFT